MTTLTVRRVSESWINRQKDLLAITVKEIKGKPNPNYTELSEEIAQAEKDLEHWKAVQAFADEQGYKINRYPVKTDSGNHEAGDVFYRKDDRSVVTVEEMAVRFDSAKQGSCDIQLTI